MCQGFEFWEGIMQNSSTWNKWDFHLHTPFSVLNNKFGDPNKKEIWDSYITNVEKTANENNIKAIGFTDYFCIEGYKKVFEYKQKGALKNIFIFPNVEFRLRESVNQKRVNYHVLLSPDLRPSDIEDDFLHNLNFVYQGDPYSSADKHKLKIQRLVEFGAMLKREHESFSNLTDLYTGCMNAVVDLEEIKEALSKKFKGQYLLVLAEENLSEADWSGQFHALRKQLIQSSHAVLSANTNTRDFYLGKKHETEQKYLDEFKTLKPCIWGCDSHGFTERFLKPDNEKYCWIKAQITWQGLKQILYEPEFRVSIQKSSPEPIKSIFSLSDLEIQKTQINNALSIDHLKTTLNSNLITIIGGRGSGKTAILDLIASCFQEGEKLSDIHNSFYHRLFKEQKNTNNQPIKTKLNFISGETFEKEIGKDINLFEQANVSYLTQDHFEEYSANPSKLNEQIIFLIFEKFPEEKRKFDYEKNGLAKLLDKIKQINLDIQLLQDDLQGKKESTESQLEKLRGELADTKKRIDLIGKQQAKKVALLDELSQTQKILKNKRRIKEYLIRSIEDLLLKVDEFTNYYEPISEAINKSLKEYQGFVETELLPRQNMELIQLHKSLEQIIMKLEKDDIKIEKGLNESKQKLSALEGLNKEIVELNIKKDEIDSKINEKKEILTECGVLANKQHSLEVKRLEIYSDYLDKTRELQDFLQNVIEHFETGKHELLENLKFTSIIDESGYRKYVQKIIEKIDNRTHSEDSVFKTLKVFGDNFSLFVNKNEERLTSPQIVEQLITALSDIKWKKSTTSSEFYNVVFSPFFEIGLSIDFNEKSLANLSMGERAIVLLKILISIDDKPLLIDQPEEHLDNKYIFSELVPTFRKSKNLRQIIIATHNANLVVNTDAEQVIIAEIENGMIKYRIGPLEDKDICESIKGLLEGGEKAFKKREEKYGLVF